MQRDRAENFDPYPLPELGPQTDARPRGFLLPQPDTERVQNADSYFERFRQAPPPGIYRPPRGMPGSAVPMTPMAPLYQSTLHARQRRRQTIRWTVCDHLPDAESLPMPKSHNGQFYASYAQLNQS
jgi:hypothetical protein